METVMYIELPSLNVVKHFVNDLSKINGDFDLISGRYVIDAKSIMGILSLDLTKPLQMKIADANESDVEKFQH